MVSAISFELIPQDNRKLFNLCGSEHANIKFLAAYFDVEINHRGHHFFLRGNPSLVVTVKRLLLELYQRAIRPFSHEEISQRVDNSQHYHNASDTSPQILKVRRKTLSLSKTNQRIFCQALSTKTINFGLGPAGSGKTYISVAKAIEAYDQARVERIVFVRPAVEAGEKIGFLPGDMIEKVSPYHRPIYDALYDLLGLEETQQLIQKNIIEITPIAFMRGRTLTRAFILLDEAQNTTTNQMKMFLTRLGTASRMVIVGDPSQIDLDQRHPSGLTDAVERLSLIPDVHITRFDKDDIVRHDIISKIIQAYDT